VIYQRRAGASARDRETARSEAGRFREERYCYEVQLDM
jgi:hypothetical protein